MRTNSEAFFNKTTMATTMGRITGLACAGSALGVTSMAVITLPICLGAILGLLPAELARRALSKKVSHISRDPVFDIACNSLLAATTTLLGILIGLAVTSFLVTLTINPFTLPALIAGGVNATILLGFYLYAQNRVRPPVPAPGPLSQQDVREVSPTDRTDLFNEAHRTTSADSAVQMTMGSRS